jgi:hypothetical protein
MLAPLVNEVNQAALVQTVKTAKMVLKVPIFQVQPVHQVIQAPTMPSNCLLTCKSHNHKLKPVNQVFLAELVETVVLVEVVNQVHQVFQVETVTEVLLVQPALLVLEVLMVKTVNQVFQVSMAVQVHKVFQVSLVLQVLEVHQVQMV